MRLRPLRLFVALATFLILLQTGAGAQEQSLRFIVVTHGAAADPFWGSVREGADLAATDAGVEVSYRAPDTFDLEQMSALVTAAVGEAPDGLVVSIPNADAVAGPIRAAIDAGIPVITINSGFDIGRSLGALLHVGQGEYEAGRVAGEAMRQAGGTVALCLNHELGNVALDLRCKGFIDGFGGSVEVLTIPTDRDAAGKAIGDKLAENAAIDVVLALNAAIGGEPAIAAAQALPEGRSVRVGTFDVNDTVLRAVAEGRAAFAIDQQPFLQGYLPVQYLALLKRRGVVPVSNVSTGPKLVTAEEAKLRVGVAPPAQPDAPAPDPEADEPAGG